MIRVIPGPSQALEDNAISIRLSLARLGLLSGLAIGAGAVGVGCLLLIGAGGVVEDAPTATLSLAVLLTALLAGRLPAAAVAVISTLALWYFFLPPRQGWALIWPDGYVTLSCFTLLVGTQIVIVDRLGAMVAAASRDKERVAALLASERSAFKELQHRVANTMQFVASLLSLQADAATNREAETALHDASARLAAMADIHRRLHDPAIAQGHFEQILRDVATDLLTSRGLAVGHGGVTLEVRIDEKACLKGLATISAVALITTEAVTNAAKHAFPASGTGRLAIALSVQDGDLVLTVADDGPGPPSDLPYGESLGLTVMQSMAQGIGGTFSLRQGHVGGALVTVTFPARCSSSAAVPLDR